MKNAIMALRPVGWMVTEASGHRSLYLEDALANNYAGHVRGAIIRELIARDEVLDLLEDAFDDVGGET